MEISTDELSRRMVLAADAAHAMGKMEGRMELADRLRFHLLLLRNSVEPEHQWVIDDVFDFLKTDEEKRRKAGEGG